MDNLKERHGCVSVWLWIALICNIFLTISFVVVMFYNYSVDADFLESYVYSICGLLTILGLILLLKWIKRGFYLLALGLLIQIIYIILSNYQYNIGICIISLITLFTSVSIWYGILHISKNKVSAWSLLENGWDYKHCRHLYQWFIGLFAIITLCVLIFFIKGNSTYSDFSDYDSICYDSLEVVEVDTVAEVDDDIYDNTTWDVFTDDAGYCSISAPNDFRKAKLNDDQKLGLICSDFDPVIVVVVESVSSLKEELSITTLKDFTGVIVKMSKNTDGASNFKKISETDYGDESRLVVYNLTIDGMEFRYNLLATKTKKYFYNCQIFCIAEYADRLQPTMDRMIESFKALK